MPSHEPQGAHMALFISLINSDCGLSALDIPAYLLVDKS
jgi:hypothetical protein